MPEQELLAGLKVGDKITSIRNGRTTTSVVTAVETVDGITTVDMRPDEVSADPPARSAAG